MLTLAFQEEYIPGRFYDAQDKTLLIPKSWIILGDMQSKLHIKYKYKIPLYRYSSLVDISTVYTG